MDFPHILVTGEAGHGKDTIGAFLVNERGYVRTAFADPLKQEIVWAYAGAPSPVDFDFLNNRDTKKTPMARLALVHCADKNFVATCLTVFAREDVDLFESLRAHVVAHPELNADALSLGSRTLKQAVLSEGFTEAERIALPRSARRIAQVWGTEYRRSTCDSYWVNKAAAFIEKSKTPVVICDGRFQNECDWANESGLRRIHIVRPGHSEILVKHTSEMIPPPDARTADLINDISPDEFDRSGFQSLFLQIEGALGRFRTDAAAIPAVRRSAMALHR